MSRASRVAEAGAPSLVDALALVSPPLSGGLVVRAPLRHRSGIARRFLALYGSAASTTRRLGRTASA